MQNGIAHAIAWISEIGHGPKHVACFSKSHFNGIIEAATSQHFQPRAIGMNTPNARRLPFKMLAIFGVDVEAMTPVGKVQHSVRTHDGAVQTGRVGR